MKILIQGAEIFDANSSHHRNVRNVLIQNGRIESISEKKPAADKVIKANGMMLSTGWVDLGAYVGDPGMESKEDLTSLSEAAVRGGFTEVAVLPNTSPVIQTKNDVSYLTRSNVQNLVKIHALAAVTRGCKGEELTEMIDLHEAGAIAFTDGLKPIWHTDILLKSLQYLQKFNGLLINHPEDIWLNMFGQMHEGVQSTMLGLKGMPRIAEEITISRDLEILQYSGGRLHFSRISSAKSVDIIRAAKKKFKVSCDITSYQPLLADTAIASFDTNYKVNPPLREEQDREALIKGLKDGTIDVICSGHTPHDEESKNIEFDLSEFGIISLQTCASNLVSLAQWVEWELLLKKVTEGPRSLLGLPLPKIEEEEKANLTLLDPSGSWTLTDKTNKSKSRNSPWWEKEIKGKVKAVFNNNKSWIDN